MKDTRMVIGDIKTHTSIMWMLKVTLNLMSMLPVWMHQMLLKVHTNMKKAKAILMKTPSLHKNVRANNKQQHKLKLAKNKNTYLHKSANDKPTWSKQTENSKSSTLRDLNIKVLVHKQIEKITVNDILMIIGTTTTGQEGNLNMSQVTQALEMTMAEMEGITTEMTAGVTATGHQVSQVCTTTMAMQT